VHSTILPTLKSQALKHSSSWESDDLGWVDAGALTFFSF
jgi:hypothetical protein